MASRFMISCGWFHEFNLEGSCRIMSMKYSTRELKDTSQLMIVRLIRFMRNHENEQINSRTSSITCNSPMITCIISKEIRNSILKTSNFEIPLLSMILNYGIHAKVMGMNNSTQRSK